MRILHETARVSALAAAVLLALAAGPATAGPPSDFALQYHTVFAGPNVDRCGEHLYFVHEGDGVDVENGPFALAMDHCIDFSAPGEGRLFDVQGTLTYPDGSTIEVAAVDIVQVERPETCVLTQEGELSHGEIVGGTGALAGATGTARLRFGRALSACSALAVNGYIWGTLNIHGTSAND